MGADRDGKAEEIFQEALDRAPDERAAFLDAACGRDPELRAEVESLLGHFEAAGSRYLHPEAVTGDESEPKRIGPYRIRELLGEGGMGRVWLAEQEGPVERQVALKVLRWGATDPQLARRAVEERRLLARMRHPNVAVVHDAGTVDDGSPFLAMEYVDGAPITVHCDDRRLPVRERLELFLGLCAGVAHAHRQGVIHRDLKPSNVLVAETEGGPTPKVIDFGIAKELETDATALTSEGHLLGTPEYMSPEQMRSEPVDTRTDVHALGLLLYELLVGRLPFADGPGQHSPVEYIRRASSRDCPRPSDRISGSDPATEEIARRRGSDVRSLRRHLRGDLDWILLKALAREPDDRYASAADLADDVRRHLRREPIVARPPSATYVARRFAQRHPAGTAVALSVLVALVAITVLTWRHSRRLAEEAETTSQALEFLVGLFEVSDPGEARGSSVTAREILDRGSDRIRDEVDDPVVRRELVGTMGRVYESLGLYDEAEPLLEEWIRLQTETRGRDDPLTLDARAGLASLYGRQGRVAESESLYLDVVGAWERAGRMDDDLALDTLHDLAVTYRRQERFAKAESLFVEYLEARRRISGPDDPGTLTAMVSLADNYGRTGEYGKAEELLVAALEGRRRVLGEDHPRTLLAWADLGNLYTKMERYGEAEAMLRESLEAQRRVLGPTHDQTLITLGSVAYLHWKRQELDRAADVLREIAEGRAQSLGPDHMNTILAWANLGSIRAMQGRTAEAESLLTAILPSQIRARGEAHSVVRNARWNLSMLAMERGDHETALEHLRISIENGANPPIDLDGDSVFSPLRGNREFERLMAILRERRSREDAAAN